MLPGSGHSIHSLKESDIRPAELLAEFFALLGKDAQSLARKTSDFVEVPCPFCHSISVARTFLKQGFEYRECKECESLYASPRPTASMLREYVLQSEAVRFWSTHFYPSTAAKRREQIFKPRAQYVARLAAGTGGGVRLIDVGAGYGLFLSEARATGRFASVAGIEPDVRLAALCREQGFEIIESWVEDSMDKVALADIATAFEVLEHVADPETFVISCLHLVKDGGLVVMTTLAASGFDIKVLGERSRAVSPPQHLNLPSVRGLHALFKRLGVELVEIETPGELDVEIVRNDVRSSPDLQVSPFIRTIIDGNEELRTAFQRFLQCHRLSSHVRVAARRPVSSMSR